MLISSAKAVQSSVGVREHAATVLSVAHQCRGISGALCSTEQYLAHDGACHRISGDMTYHRCRQPPVLSQLVNRLISSTMTLEVYGLASKLRGNCFTHRLGCPGHNTDEAVLVQNQNSSPLGLRRTNFPSGRYGEKYSKSRIEKSLCR